MKTIYYNGFNNLSRSCCRARYAKVLLPLSVRFFSSQPTKTVIYPSPARSTTEEIEYDDDPLSKHAWTITPAGEHAATVIWLHGMGEHLDSLKPMFTALSMPRIKYIIPRAPLLPITALQDHEERTWFDLYEETFTSKTKEDEAGIELMTKKVHALLAEEAEKVQSCRIILAGVAQGGALAVHAGMTWNKPLLALTCVSGYVPLMQNYPQCINQANRLTPILAVHGNGDKAIPIEFTRPRFSKLSDNKVPVEFRADFYMTHRLTIVQMVQIFDWINYKIRTATQKPS